MGIESNPNKCATIIGMRSPTNVREVQQLTGCMTPSLVSCQPVETKDTTTSNVLKRIIFLCALVNARKLSPS